MGQAQGQPARSARCIALVGPYLSGKTTLLEAILARTGAIDRARAPWPTRTLSAMLRKRPAHHGMSVEINVADHRLPRRQLHLPRLPGLDRIPGRGRRCARRLRRGHRRLRARREEGAGAPTHPEAAGRSRHSPLPVHQQDRQGRGAACATSCRCCSRPSTKPLVLRQVPIWENDIVTGFIDLALERAFVYREHAPSEVDRHPGDTCRRRETRRASPCSRSSPTTTTS